MPVFLTASQAVAKIEKTRENRREAASRLKDRLLDLLFPPRCPFCRALLRDYEHDLCKSCAAGLPRTQGAARVQRLEAADRCAAPLYYEGTVRESLLRYKFHSLYSYAPCYAKLIDACLRDCALSCDLIGWVPVSDCRRRQRGYDQAELIARELARLNGLPCERLLRKTVHNPAQSTLRSAELRRKNVRGAYAAVDPGRIAGKRVLLLDDIVTTGATLDECAKTLKRAGAVSVCAAALARSRY